MQATGGGSLERFVKAKGWMFIGTVSSRRAFNVQAGIGGSLLIVGLAIMALPLFGVDRHVFFASLGPLIAGGTNLGVALACRKVFGRNQAAPVSLTPEARGVMRTLNRKYLGMYGWYWGEGSWQGQRVSPAWSGSYGFSAIELPAVVLDQLEQAAFQYNRVSALLAASDRAQNAASRLAPKVEAACNEGMAEVLHQAGLIGAFPEGSEAVLRRLEAVIGEMSELADRTQSLVTSEPTFTERLAQRSGIHDVLDELRMEQMARMELGARTSDHDEQVTGS